MTQVDYQCFGDIWAVPARPEVQLDVWGTGDEIEQGAKVNQIRWDLRDFNVNSAGEARDIGAVGKECSNVRSDISEPDIDPEIILVPLQKLLTELAMDLGEVDEVSRERLSADAASSIDGILVDRLLAISLPL